MIKSIAMPRISGLFLLFLVFPLLASSEVYVVYFRGDVKGKTFEEIEDFHHSFLTSLKGTEEDAKSSLLYSYKYINGLAAVLTPDEASKLSGTGEVVSVIRTDKVLELLTTRSWEFLGLANGEAFTGNNEYKTGGEDLMTKANYGKDVVIGFVDSGVTPESESFNEVGMEALPAGWKGSCEGGPNFTSSLCNKKLIGAKFFVAGTEPIMGNISEEIDHRSPRDVFGHGTHTAATAAGRQVPNVAFLGGLANGTASGGAPLARVAIYKSCWMTPMSFIFGGGPGCTLPDTAAGIEAAIADGVDIISLSIGQSMQNDSNRYADDLMSVATLHAVKYNILPVVAAGNSGAGVKKLASFSPWMLIVAASSLDRGFLAPVILGNNSEIMGESITPIELENKFLPLVSGEQAAVKGANSTEARECADNSLDPAKVKGKIVLCWGITSALKGLEVQRAGGVGFIFASDETDQTDLGADFPQLIPETHVTYDDGLKIVEYINSAKDNATAILTSQPKTSNFYKEAPAIAEFSSTGPNDFDPFILKPDITAPGVNILAAWPETKPPSEFREDKRIVKYNLMSGTSMATPHVSGAAALIRAIHPDWSVGAIKSALMTTATITNNRDDLIRDSYGNIATPFQYGAGHLWPIKAVDPGLVYNITYDDYMDYLCGLNQSKEFDSSYKCPSDPITPLDLNLPSFQIPKLDQTYSFSRAVTNVGDKTSTYYFTTMPPPGVHVEATPSILNFTDVGQEQCFTITVSPAPIGNHSDSSVKNAAYGFGWYSWSDGKHYVRSPMAVYLP